MTISPLLADAKSAHHAGDLERAIAGYRSVLEGGPDAATSNLLAIALDGSGRADEAEAVLARGHEVEPDLAELAINLARLRLRRGAAGEAIPPLRRAGDAGSQEALALLFEVANAAGLHADVLSSGRRLWAAGSLQVGQAERLGEVALRVGAEDTQSILGDAVRRFPASARLQLLLAHRLGQGGAHAEAVTAFRRSQCLAPTDLDAVFNAARILDLMGENKAASGECGRALAIAPGWPDALLLGARIEALHGSPTRARTLATQALAALPAGAKAHAAFALARFAGGEKEAAIAGHRRALLLDPADAMEWNDRGVMLKQVGAVSDARFAYGRARTISTELLPAIKNHAALLFDMTDMEAAAAAYDHALRIAPDDAGLAMKRAMTFPTILRSEAEIDTIRADIERRMQAIKRSGLVIADPLKDVGRPNFYLAYHGRNDRDLQTLIADTYLALSPGLAQVAPHCVKPRSAEGRKLRIGFASRFFYDHSIRYSTAGIVRNLDRERFEVHVFSDLTESEITLFRDGESADSHTILPLNLAEARAAIANRQLDVLIYGDIGMEPLTYYLAFARLAPVQAHLQGHPVSPGIPNIDYFITSAQQEPEGCEAHYRETPVQLGGTLFCYDAVEPPEPSSRAEFGLPQNGALYFCPQTLFKFHPSFDAILRDILDQDPEGWLILLEDRQPLRTRQLDARIRAALGPHADRVLWVKRQAKPRYFQLVQLCDVMLDTTHFSGANTTLQSLGLGVPVVTLPGQFVRGRMTLGWLREADLMEMCARDDADYARIAVRLAKDREWRATIIGKIMTARGCLFESPAVVDELQDFLLAAQKSAAAGASPLQWKSRQSEPS